MRGPDYGPIYTETNLDRFPVEPLNSLSNIFFLWLVVHWWTRRQHLKSKDFKKFLDFSLPVLFIGFVGGTVYHATRWHWVWLALDIVPIVILSLFTSFYHWRYIPWPRWKALLVILGLMVSPFLLMKLVLGDARRIPSLGYMVLVVVILFPIVLDQFRQKWPQWRELSWPILLIALALVFRIVDNSAWVVENFPWGTHWLWHSFGALTCHVLLIFMEKRSEFHQ